MPHPLKIIGISGSLRKTSYNTALLKAAAALMPTGIEFEIAEIGEIPLYNGDLELNHFPESVQILREKIRASNGLLIATPEYNYSMSGVLKNTIDWLSRPSTDPVLFDKPLAIIGASMGMMGSARAQYHLRQSAVFLNMHVLNKPELFVNAVHTKFNEQLELTDLPTQDVLKQVLESFQKWIKQLEGK
ncbi:MAG: NAD(P)H-dependent oxidoreductase [Gammaproteobacteria bacterium]|jgi:chromate reductase|nr:NAD(P)H-dependent oxidoreductase [Gammaproteobacteria bacterium]